MQAVSPLEGQIVPVEPTLEMLSAMTSESRRSSVYETYSDVMARVYRAALNAAPICKMNKEP